MESWYHEADILVWCLSAFLSIFSVPFLALGCPNGFLVRLLEANREFLPMDLLCPLISIFAISLNFLLIGKVMSGDSYVKETLMRKLGCLNKTLIDILALAVSLILRYSFDGICNSITWALMVIEFQIICKMLYGSPDLWFTDVIVGVIMQIIVVYKKEDLYHLITMIILCLLIIYHRHWSTPSSTTIFIEKKEIGQVQEIDAQKTTTTPHSVEKTLEDV